MCGRIVQATSPEEIAREFGADLSVVLRESLSALALVTLAAGVGLRRRSGAAQR